MEFVNFFKNKKNIILVIIVFLAIILIFFRLDRADMQTDGAHYSFRAIGYLDYMYSQLQTTPIQWFKVIPWWGWLSFHDHPPLVFLIQHIFFILFGISLISARLPVALAGVGSVILLYLIGKELYDRRYGILASLLLTVSTFFIWMSRINYLEGIETFFILLAVLFFLKL
jgi:4-amino-4-deoxy-L-arabinose transferase-like glycosyltransferase